MELLEGRWWCVVLWCCADCRGGTERGTRGVQWWLDEVEYGEVESQDRAVLVMFAGENAGAQQGVVGIAREGEVVADGR